MNTLDDVKRTQKVITPMRKIGTITALSKAQKQYKLQIHGYELRYTWYAVVSYTTPGWLKNTEHTMLMKDKKSGKLYIYLNFKKKYLRIYIE